MYKDIFTSIDNEPCFIREPNNSNRQGIIIIGGSSCFVTKDSSDFHENKVRNDFINELVGKGYTVGYSNTHNKNWGSPKAVKDIVLLYNALTRKYGVNKNIHLIATSMGCLVALNLFAKALMPTKSLILVKPVMDLLKHRNYVLSREGRDRIADEVSNAYNLTRQRAIERIINVPITFSDDVYKQTRIKIIYGKIDDTAPFDNNLNMINKLSKCCSHLEISGLNNAKHGSDEQFFNSGFYLRFLGHS